MVSKVQTPSTIPTQINIIHSNTKLAASQSPSFEFFSCVACVDEKIFTDDDEVDYNEEDEEDDEDEDDKDVVDDDDGETDTHYCSDCANRYKDRKTKLMKHFDKEGGYEDTKRAKHNPLKGMDPKAWVQDNITEQLNKAKSSCGDDTPVDEVEVLERSLGQRRGHVRGVGRTVKSITPNLPPHIYAPPTNKLQQQLAKANAR
ncbi:hypothetical protein R6Q57_023909 [Mikania cordata]